jgi:hypothetical protein
MHHSNSEDEIDEMLLLIRDSFTPAFEELEKTLRKKLDEAGDGWECEKGIRNHGYYRWRNSKDWHC